jgi:HEAT repeat protein/ATP/ADP translocase
MLAARVSSLFQIRSGEGRLVGLVAALFALLEVGRNIGANAADGLFFVRFGAEYLPYMTIALGALSFIITLSYTVGLGRFNKGLFFVGILGAFGAVLLVERIALLFDWAFLYPILWLTINIASVVLGTLEWNIAAEVCDARQAKRLFSLFTSAAILGGVVGNLITGVLAKSLGTENLLVLDALLLFVGLACSRAIARDFFKPAVKRAEGTSWLDELRVGYDFVRGSRLMLLIAISSILFSILYFSVYIPYSKIVAVSFPNEADLAGFLGLVSSAITLLTLVVSLFVANRLYARVGIVNAVLLLPTTYLVGFILLALNGTLAAAVAVRLAQMVIMSGIAGSAWNAFFNVVPPEKRSQVQSFDGGVTSQIGTALSGVLPLVAAQFLSTTQIYLAGVLAALITGYLIWQMRHEYGVALVDALRGGFLDVFTAARRGFQSMSADAHALNALLAELADEQPARRRVSVEILGQLGDRSAIEPLGRMLDDSDREVRRAALEALVQLDAREETASVARRVADPAPQVRADAVHALSVLSQGMRSEFLTASEDAEPVVRAGAVVALFRAGQVQRAKTVVDALLELPDPAARVVGLDAIAACRANVPVKFIAGFLSDPSPQVRLAATRVLGGLDDPSARDVLVKQLDDENASARIAAATALRDSGADPDVLVRVLRAGSERAQEAALVALHGNGAAARKALIDWALAQIPRAAQFRAWSTCLSHMDGGASRSVILLRDLLCEREWQTEQRILNALALIGSEESIKLIAAGLRARDQQLRAEALEALDTLGDRRIAHGLVPLLEETPGGSAARDPRAVLAELSAHPDPWLRAFAVRALTVLLAHEWQALIARTRADPVDFVRQAAEEAGEAKEGPLTETLKTLGTLDRILFLRQVPLFGNLAPEDLEQISQVATERVFSPNDYVCREGEIGDELFVIVEGQVKITKGSNGEMRTLRTLQAGEHIGELAILREQPRSASAVADPGNVRALAIRGAALKSILRDRPEVAMAMLGSLAERMSTLT